MTNGHSTPGFALRGSRALAAIALACFPCALYGQFTDPRTYANTPADLNQFELGYGYASADASIDTSLIVGGAHFDLNTATAAYTRTFGIAQRLAWVKASIPFAAVRGSVGGTGISGSVAGAGDASLEFTSLLMGGPALRAPDFARHEPTTTLGVSLTVTGPTGEYNPDRILNLGSDRWSFKPQLAVSHPFGPEHRWEVDGYASAYFFTDNTSYHGHEILRQEPLLGIEGHVSYNFTQDLWASLDASYAWRGDTVVDGVNQQDAQKYLTVGAELNWSLAQRNSIALVLAKSVVHDNAPAATGVVLKYFYTWGPGY